MRRRIEELLHVTATDNYGLSDVMGPGIASECLARDGLHVNEDHFLVEVLDPVSLQPVPPGATGELVITTLTKEAFPLIRYRTRDLTALQPAPCPCDRTSVRLRRIEARSDDMLVVKGVNVFPSQVEAILREVEGREPHFRILLERKHALDEATVMVAVPTSTHLDEVGRHTAFRDELRRRLQADLGVAFEIKLVEKKTLEAAGTARVVDLRRR
jgi:phenylacetate-CoA ligase